MTYFAVALVAFAIGFVAAPAAFVAYGALRDVWDRWREAPRKPKGP